MKKLSDLLEKLEMKFPDDKDVLNVVSEFKNMGMDSEEMEAEDEDLALEGEMPSDDSLEEPTDEKQPMDFAALLSEDMSDEPAEEDELELAMPPKKSKKPKY